MLDRLRDIFLDALCYAPKHKRAVLISKWNKECQNVYELKEELKREEKYKAKQALNCGADMRGDGK